ncbi:MAG TPA: hypothetical protein PK572_09575 [Kiritimatiellia bacterium]|nr:hypothetical protein [Kiritimatiellia bacterium]
MRTIEEIKKDIETEDLDQICDVLKLYYELAQAQDERIKKLEAEITRLRQYSEWQPIETAPKDGTVIMILDGGDPTVGKWGLSRRKKIMEWRPASFAAIWDATLWLPIPPLTKAKEEKEESHE